MAYVDDVGASEIRGARVVAVSMEFPMKIHVSVRRHDRAGWWSIGCRLAHGFQGADIECRNTAGFGDAHLHDAAVFAAQGDFQVGAHLLIVERMFRRELLEVSQESVSENLVQTLVNLIQIGRKRHARRVECSLIPRLDVGDVVFDRPAPSIEADVGP